MLGKADDLIILVYAEIDYRIENEALEYLSDYYATRSSKVMFSGNNINDIHDHILSYYASKKQLSEEQI